jgi:hypothetical protein
VRFTTQRQDMMTSRSLVHLWLAMLGCVIHVSDLLRISVGSLSDRFRIAVGSLSDLLGLLGSCVVVVLCC